MFNNILSSTTKLHHKSVLILSLANLFVDYSKPTIWRWLVAYAYYSALAFYVNTFLGTAIDYKTGKYCGFCSWFNPLEFCHPKKFK